MTWHRCGTPRIARAIIWARQIAWHWEQLVQHGRQRYLRLWIPATLYKLPLSSFVLDVSLDFMGEYGTIFDISKNGQTGVLHMNLKLLQSRATDTIRISFLQIKIIYIRHTVRTSILHPSNITAYSESVINGESAWGC